MRILSREPGVYLSGVAHVSALVLMLVALPSAKPFDDAVEAVSVEVMTADQFAALTPGSKAEKDITPKAEPKSEPAPQPKPAKTDGKPKAETKPSVLPPPPRVAEKPAKDAPVPKPAQKPAAQPKEKREEPPPLRTASLPPKRAEAKPVDKAKSVKEEEKDADEVIRQLQAEEAERAKKAEAKLREQKEKAEAKAKAEAAEEAKAKAAATKLAEKKKAEAEKRAAAEAEAERKAAEAAEAERIAEAKAKAAAEKAKLAEAQKAKAAEQAAAEKKAAAKAAAAEQARKDKLAALIKSKQASDRTQDDGSDDNQINAKKASTAAKSGQDAPEPQSSGGTRRAGTSLSPAQKEGLANAIIERLRECVTNLGGDEISEAPRIRISIGPDGALQGTPKILRASDDAANALARAAIRGARSCAPFDIPAQYRQAMADADGADLTITLNPSDLQ